MAFQTVSSHSGSAYTADTLTDLYTNASATLTTTTMSIAIYNPESTAKAVEIWRTNAAGTGMQQCIAKLTIAAATVVGDNSLYGIKPGEKIRFKSAHINVMFTATLYDGLA